MMSEAIRFRGVIPPVTTPFLAEGAVLYDVLEENLRKYLNTVAAGFLLLGSNGEAPHLSPSEKLEIVRRSGAIIPADRYLLVGVASQTLVETVDFLGKIRELRVDAVLVSVPAYYKDRMNEEALHRYFVEVGNRSDFPVLLYNIPQFTGIEIPPGLVGELASHHNIVGMKDSSGSVGYLERILEQTQDEDFQVILGSAGILGPALVLGIEAAILAVACVLPGLPHRLMKDYQEGADIRNRQFQLAQVSRCVTDDHGIPGLKYAMDLLGFEGGESRLPLLPLGEDQKVDVERVFGPLLNPGGPGAGKDIELST
ncbi:MAG: dihydrodipicolinate synthase family protein [Acidobacteriota bacterium]